MRKIFWLLSLPLGIACGRPAKSDRWFHPDLAEQLRFVDAADGASAFTDIWRGHGVKLQFTSEISAQETQKVINGAKLVMVTYVPDTDFAEVLEYSGTTLGLLRGIETNLALIKIDHDEAGNALAAAAHAASGHMCGTITPVALRGLTAPVETLIPAVHPEAAELKQVTNMLAAADQNRIFDSIRSLETLGTRFHASASGLAATAKVAELFRLSADLESQAVNLTEIDHSGASITQSTNQKSLIVSFPGQVDDGTTIVLGAHLDSINRSNNQDAPGADDDASGIATLIEIARIIASSGAKFQRRLELHAYAGEEIALIGSRDIAFKYRQQNRKVSAMLQIDMNSWSRDPRQETIHLVLNDTHVNLRRSIKDLLNTYLGGKYAEKSLTGGTSDHRSWSDEGYAAVFPFEDPDDYNRSLHTPQDTTTTVNNFALSKRFAQLGLAFAAHHAGLIDDTVTASKQALRNTTSNDLRLAIIPAGMNAYYVHIATSEAIAAVDFCLTDSAGSLGCTKARVVGSATKLANGRKFFAPVTSLSLLADSRLAVVGYDGNDKLAAYRTVRLASKL